MHNREKIPRKLFRSFTVLYQIQRLLTLPVPKLPLRGLPAPNPCGSAWQYHRTATSTVILIVTGELSIEHHIR